MITLGPIDVDESKLAKICGNTGCKSSRSSDQPHAEPCAWIATSICWSNSFPKPNPDHAGLMLDLSELLGRKVDLVSKNGLKPLIRDSVIGDARRLYAA